MRTLHLLLTIMASLLLATFIGFALVVYANAKIVPDNWQPCGNPANGVIRRNGDTWDNIPAWARSPAIAAWYGNDDILLSNHGLCNAKFRRIVLCLPGWDEPGADESAPWFKVCKAWELTR